MKLNRESQYFEVLIKLFDVYLNVGKRQKGGGRSLERLVDIDAYDYRNQGATGTVARQSG